MPAGHPSIVTPMPGPWDSPKTDTLKTFPKVFMPFILFWSAILPVEFYHLIHGYLFS
jgi:hypothetical protein